MAQPLSYKYIFFALKGSKLFIIIDGLIRLTKTKSNKTEISSAAHTGQTDKILTLRTSSVTAQVAK